MRGVFKLTPQPVALLCGVNTFTLMPHHSAPEKTQALKTAGTFNTRAKQVRHPLFEESAFFDPCDLPQLKYEALRAIQKDDYSITQAADEFGLSRPTLYHAQEQFDKQGLEGLLARKRGPKKARKLTPDVWQYLMEQAATQPSGGARQLAQRVSEKFKIRLHPRTIEKALKTKAKRGLQTPS
jgi:transposase